MSHQSHSPLHSILNPQKTAALIKTPPTPAHLDLQPLLSRNRIGSDIVAFTLQEILSPQECQAMINRSEAIGYRVALVNTGPGKEVHIPGYRDSQRALIDDPIFAAELWERVKAHVPAVYQKRPVIGINERLRFLKYSPGDQFQAHMDGEYKRTDGSGQVTKITIQFYLNEDCVGGATTFLEEKSMWARSDNNDFKKVEVNPKVGQVLIFQHDLVHEGSLVVEGQKYVVRSDILYGPPIRTV
ncbi:hypothetical protein BGZ51_003657 [Haplosporangium sp. Z 767]|nr:hypothetical protein BGZ51_003657 [Haplosporangium sp. Z 767]KAF9190110.1 hypothetical protein BGZ50_000459 [Haplosporangium sp. Z 11]